MHLDVTYHRRKTLQALRYHFISRKEIKFLLILVNIFSIVAAALFFFKKISPQAFLLSSFLWFTLMIIFWYALPMFIYHRSSTFKEKVGFEFNEKDIILSTVRGNAKWPYRNFQYYMESPHFFHLYINDRSFFYCLKMHVYNLMIQPL